MRNRISVTNNGAGVMYVGSVMIQPGDTRDFDADQVPEHLRPQGGTTESIDGDRAAAEKAAADAAEAERIAQEAAEKAAAEEAAGKKLADLLAGTVDNIRASFPVLSDEEIAALETAEKGKGEGARKTLLEAISAEILARADKA